MSKHSSSPIQSKHPTATTGRTLSPATQSQMGQSQPRIQITSQSNQSRLHIQTQSNQTNAGPLTQEQLVPIIKRINKSENSRYQSVQTLISIKSNFPDLALMLWFSPATVTSLLSDVLNFYPVLVSAQPNASMTRSAEMAYNSLVLLQVIADHEDTKLPFVRANIPIYLIPIIHHTLLRPDSEHITGVVMAIISSLVKINRSPTAEGHQGSSASQQLRFSKNKATPASSTSNSASQNKNQPNQEDDPLKVQELHEIIESLINAEFVSTCLRVLSQSRGLIRASAAFVLNKILSDEKGKSYAYDNKERVIAILKILNQILTELGTEFDPQLSKNIVEAYKSLLPPSASLNAQGSTSPNGNDPVVQMIGSLISDNLRTMTINQSCDNPYRELVGQLRNYPSKPMKR
ncbi:Cell differentiation protein RCD1 [Tritrichomonas musculus]|uniref:Cell differentiation protein RCD1 n=1 Tax=Tritrichomonas musculus TaxID=1915356 RepID=A0ABR2H995_9EUKA